LSLVEKALEKAKLGSGQDRRDSHVEALPTSIQPATPLRSELRLEFDRERLKAEGMLPPDEDRQQIADQFRVIKRRLLKQSTDGLSDSRGNSQFIMVASALPSDGKTFSCVNLALGLASERDVEVILIDGDIAKPHISRTLGIQDAPGLLDLLRDPQRTIDSVLHATDLPGLAVMGAGKWSENASELIASERLRSVLAEIASRDKRRVVLMDSPPTLATPDARMMAQRMGQVVLVVRSGVTPQQAVLDTVEALKEGSAKISVIMNQVTTSVPFNYLYGYGYGAGYGSSYGKAP